MISVVHALLLGDMASNTVAVGMATAVMLASHGYVFWVCFSVRMACLTAVRHWFKCSTTLANAGGLQMYWNNNGMLRAELEHVDASCAVPHLLCGMMPNWSWMLGSGLCVMLLAVRPHLLHWLASIRLRALRANAKAAASACNSPMDQLIVMHACNATSRPAYQG